MTEKNAVEIIGLKKKYPGVNALKNINVEFPTGVITGLIGPNGSGKSTLLKSIIGLVKATNGEIKIYGNGPDRNSKEIIAFLPEINHLYKNMTIKQIISFFDSQFENFDRSKAKEILDFMNLKEVLKIKNLSKGMVARLKLVLTMARRVPLIIMDEPLAGIDPKSRSRILESLISEYDAGEQTIILSTHEIIEAERFFDYVIFLKNGEIKLKGNADDLRKEHGKSIQELVKEVFI